MTDNTAKKRGRPPKAKEDRRDANLTFRATPEVRAQLEQLAFDANRSFSWVIEQAVLEYNQRHASIADILLLIGKAISIAESKLGRHCFSDEEAAHQTRVAAETALDIAFGRRSRLDTWTSNLTLPTSSGELGVAPIGYQHDVEMAGEVAAKLRGHLGRLERLATSAEKESDSDD
jgi:predicted transcriptional regulator